MYPSSPEREPAPTLESRFSDLIDAKFNAGRANRDIAREHEEELRLLSTRSLELCPTATNFRLIRPIPAEAKLAEAEWSHYGGPRADVFEADERGISSVQSDFFAIADTMYCARTHDVPGESVAVPPEPLTDSQVADLLDWINTAIPEQ